jgi:cGMP-dependent protein kinase
MMKGQVIRTITKGQNIGEISLLLNSPRTMDVIAKTDCTLFAISVEILIKLVGQMYREIFIYNFILHAYDNSDKFSKIEPAVLENTYSLFKVSHFKKNDIVYNSGYNVMTKIHILAEGNLINGSTNQIFARKGVVLFEEELSKDEECKLNFDIKSESDCLICEADVESFSKAIGFPLQTLFNRGKVLESINKVPLFKQLSENKKSLLIENLKKLKLEAGKAIISQGEEGSRFYIIKKGKVDIFINNSYQRTLNKHEYFGERALFFKEKRSATAIAKEPVTLYVLEKDSFQKILDGNLKDYLLKHLFLQDNKIDLNSLTFFKKLGNGSYGQVYLVTSNQNNFPYAMKIISKKQIDYEKMHPNFEMERKILLQVDFPFIVKMVKSLKDDKYIYFLMEYIKGQELFDIIREIGLLNKNQNLFYSASIMLAIDYLHGRKFIYRDIKPENIMVLDNVI